MQKIQNVEIGNAINWYGQPYVVTAIVPIANNAYHLWVLNTNFTAQHLRTLHNGTPIQGHMFVPLINTGPSTILTPSQTHETRKRTSENSVTSKRIRKNNKNPKKR